VSSFEGPKEWRPPQWEGSPVLSPDENVRYRKLLRLSKKKGWAPDPKDFGWLLELAGRLATASPAEYEFPKYLALWNQQTTQAFALLYKETLVWQKKADRLVEGAQHHPLFEHSTSCQVTDAIALIRPWIQIHPGADSESIRDFRLAALKLSIDNSVVLYGPVDEHLIDPWGVPYRKVRWKLQTKHDFTACRLNERNEPDVSGVEGFFCPNGSWIQMELFFPSEFRGTLGLTAGLVAARYSTKAE
jgi:hypothetical protein